MFASATDATPSPSHICHEPSADTDAPLSPSIDRIRDRFHIRPQLSCATRLTSQAAQRSLVLLPAVGTAHRCNRRPTFPLFLPLRAFASAADIASSGRLHLPGRGANVEF